MKICNGDYFCIAQLNQTFITIVFPIANLKRFPLQFKFPQQSLCCVFVIGMNLTLIFYHNSKKTLHFRFALQFKCWFDKNWIFYSNLHFLPFSKYLRKIDTFFQQNTFGSNNFILISKMLTFFVFGNEGRKLEMLNQKWSVQMCRWQ